MAAPRVSKHPQHRQKATKMKTIRKKENNQEILMMTSAKVPAAHLAEILAKGRGTRTI
jgi:hypothetical protein